MTVRKNNDLKFPTQPQSPPIRVDLSQAESISCEACGNHTFVAVFFLRKISALLAPSGKETIAPVQTFACNACGFVNKDFLPFSEDKETE